MNYIDDDFTPTGNLCYINDNGKKLPTTTSQEFYNLRWFIQHLIDKNRSEYGDHDYFNPLHESNWIYQTLQKMTPEQLKIKPFKPIIKVNTNQELDTNEGESIKDEEESITSTELTQDSKPTETLQIHNVCNTTTHAKDELPESEENL